MERKGRLPRFQMSFVPRIFILCPPLATAETIEVATLNKGVAMMGWETERIPTTATKEVVNETILEFYMFLIAKENCYKIR